MDADLPPFPDELRGVWLAFLALDATRPAAMGPSPITYQEIAEFNRLEQVGLSASHVRLIRRLDRLAMKAAQARSASPDSAETVGVPIHDDAAIASMFKGGAARRRQLSAAR